jgi:hypothetical protein
MKLGLIDGGDFKKVECRWVEKEERDQRGPPDEVVHTRLKAQIPQLGAIISNEHKATMT